MEYHPLASELNKILASECPNVYQSLSSYGKALYFPRGILSQAQEAKEKAQPGLNATIGIATDGDEPLHLAAVQKYFAADLKASEIYPYAPAAGIKELRSAWLEKITKENPTLNRAHCSRPVVCHALTHALAIAAELFTDPGDSIILPSSYWGNYNMILGLRRGLKFSTYDLFDSKLESLAVAELARALDSGSSDKKVLLLNFPHNPSGYAPSFQEAAAIVEVVNARAHKGSKIVVLCDDAYFGMNYEEGLQTESFFALLSNAHENITALKIDGFTKEAFAWGFRVGFLSLANAGLSPKSASAIEKKITGAIRATISSTCHPTQSILLRALRDDAFGAQRQSKIDVLKERYRVVKECAYQNEYKNLWKVYPFNSGYFMSLRLSCSSEKLRQLLLKEYGIGTVASGEYDLRIAFSCIRPSKIEKVFAAIASAIKKVQLSS